MSNTMNWDSKLYNEKHSFVYGYGKGLVELLQPQAGEKILDLGCGTGILTKEIADTGADVTGIDNSPSMVEKARYAYPGLKFEVMDASDFKLPYLFDAIFSNAVLHWVKEKEKAVRCMHAALRPGGRLIIEFGGKGNVSALIKAVTEAVREVTGTIPDTSFWYFPSLGDYAALLENYGFRVTHAWHYDRPTELIGENGIKDWFRMFGELIFKDLPEEKRENILESTQQKLSSSNRIEGKWFADYKRLRIIALKEY